MKILKKYKRLFTFLLTIILCFVIVFQSVSISASAESLSVYYYSVVPNSEIMSFGSFDYVKGYSTIQGSISKGNATIFHTASFSSLGTMTNKENLNGDFKFTFVAPAVWTNSFNNGDLYTAIIIKNSKGEIYPIQGNYESLTFGSINGSDATRSYTMTLKASVQALFLQTYLPTWSQCEIVGVGIRCDGNISGNLTVKSISCVLNYDAVGSADGEFKWFNPIKKAISSIFDACVNILVKRIDALGRDLKLIWDTGKIILKPLLEEVFLPTLNKILTALNTVAEAIGRVMTPIIADIVNFFTPYFNEIITAFSNHFVNLVTTLNPFINNFITAITPSFNSIVETLSNNISNIFNECFKPDINSEEFADFVALKDTVSNKFPIFSQLKQFLVVLFEPTNYAPNYNTDDYVSVNGKRIVRNTGTVEYAKFGQIVKVPFKERGNCYFSCSYKSKVNNGSFPVVRYLAEDGTYKMINTTTNLGNDNVWRKYYCQFDTPLDAMNKQGYAYFFVGFTTGRLGSDTYYCDFLFYNTADVSKTNLLTNSNFAYGLYGWTSIGYNLEPISEYNINHTMRGDVELIDYTNDTVSNEFVVNIYGKQVSALNFDWYLPYKKYGDICVIAFCYLAFIWHTFKRLPSLI